MCRSIPTEKGAGRYRGAVLFMGLAALVYVGNTPVAWAHIDPPGSSAPGIGISITVFRADGVTPVIGPQGGTVAECETILYQATFAKLPAPNGALEGGTWVLTTPDGVVHPLGTVPCIGGTFNDPNSAANGGRGLCANVPISITSALVPYTVRAVDPDPFSATTSINGVFAHISASDQPAGFAGFGIPVSKEPPCGDQLACNGVERCDPNLRYGGFGERMGGCVPATPLNCDDGNVCTTDACVEPTGCVHSTPPNCDDGNVCTVDVCTGPNEGDCSHSTPPTCDDGNPCTEEWCTGPFEGNCIDSLPPNCDDFNVCTTDACTGPNPGDCNYVPSELSQTCGTSDACVDRGCDPTTGCFEHDHSSECGTSETCVIRGCDPATGCFERDPDPRPAECEPQLGCRISAGGITPDGGVDTGDFADILNAHFGGQVGAPCGCIGCFDGLDQVQGSWETSRRNRRGSFHALDFNSLVCGCDGVLDGQLCNPGDRELGPEPRPAPANVACFSGVGDFNPTNGRKVIHVAFRVEVEDRSEPAVGKVAPDDIYRIRIWIPTKDETAAALADQVCCTHATPTGRNPDIDDGGNLIDGNIQIHPPTPNTEKGVCPVPNGSCQQ